MTFAKASSENAENSTRSKRISDATFARFFSALLSLCILLTLYLELDLRGLIFGDPNTKSIESETKEIIATLLKNEITTKRNHKKTKKFLSDKESEASGNLTREKGFEAASSGDVLAYGDLSPIRAKILSHKSITKILTAKESSIRIATAKEQDEEEQPGVKQLRIPWHHKFRNDLALSWDYAGRPIIPTIRFAYYDYFKRFLNKFQEVWAPPGGQPYPTFGDAYHRMNYGSGSTRFSTFPTQDVQVLVLIDDTGVVQDVKIVASLGFKSLDQSVIDGFMRVKDIGPPPKELVQDGILIIPILLRIYGG